MKLRFVQSGGSTGLSREIDVEEAALPVAEAASLSALQGLYEAGQLSEAAASEARDALIYQLELTSPGKPLRFAFTDLTIPEVARPLIGFLRRRARPSGSHPQR